MTGVMATAALILPSGIEYELGSDTTIGRDPDNDLVLDSKAVSRKHARITEAGGRWFIEDRGSFNGTIVNEARIGSGVPLPLRHSDRIQIGRIMVVFSSPTEAVDADRTDTLEEEQLVYARQLSPLQQRVVAYLCAHWLGGATLDRLPSNEQIAAELGTPGAVDTVKAALRRAYVKAGISDLPAHAKRRALCRIARQRGWV
jgi:pSer/pThr/pTyr-binding forkhead associated (FHA) protein